MRKLAIAKPFLNPDLIPPVGYMLKNENDSTMNKEQLLLLLIGLFA